MELEKSKEENSSSAVPDLLASTAPQLSSVEDLERRLKLMESVTPPTPPVVAAAPPKVQPAAAPAPSAAAASGKMALLVSSCF